MKILHLCSNSSVIPQCWDKFWGTERVKSDIVSIPIFLSRVIKDGRILGHRPILFFFSEFIIKGDTVGQGGMCYQYGIIQDDNW